MLASIGEKFHFRCIQLQLVGCTLVKVVQTGVLLQWHFHAGFIYPVATAVTVLIFWEDLFAARTHGLMYAECADEQHFMYMLQYLLYIRIYRYLHTHFAKMRLH